MCERCFRFLGPLETQMRGLLRGIGNGAADAQCPAQLPRVDGERHLPAPVLCGCGLRYCSEACRDASYAEYHKLLCPAAAAMAAGGGGASSDAMQVDEGPTQPAAEAIQAKASAWGRFEEHALATNEIFLMAAKAAALVLGRCQAGQTLQQAAAEFSEGLPWWDAVARPEDIAPEDDAGFRQAMRDALTQSWQLLCPLLAPHAPPDFALLASVDAYATIVGSFVQVSSPIGEYFLLVDDLPEGAAATAAITAVTAPLLATLDAAYDTACEGIGLFPLQATLNHSCAPNVWLRKIEEEEEHDGRVVAVLKEEVRAGDELCNSYIDIELPYAQRQRELAEYGFACTCVKCVAEQTVAAAPARPPRKLK